MRARMLLAMVVVLLFSALATTEIPELLNLADNASNDYSVVVIARSDSSLDGVRLAGVVASLSRAAISVTAALPEAKPEAIRSASQRFRFVSQRALLPTLCIRRT